MEMNLSITNNPLTLIRWGDYKSQHPECRLIHPARVNQASITVHWKSSAHLAVFEGTSAVL
jgi:hypothetical protein